MAIWPDAWEFEAPYLRTLMRILFISRQYPPDTQWGGIGSYIATVAKALVSRGHEVHVLSCVEGQKQDDSVLQGVNLHKRSGRWPIRGGWRIKRLLPSLRTLWRLEIGIDTYCEYRRLGIDFDVIEYADWGGMGSILALFHPSPLVAHTHVPPPLVDPSDRELNPLDFRWASTLVYFSVNRADLVTSASSYLLEKLREARWLHNPKVEIIQNPVEWRDMQDLDPVSNSPPSVLFLGRLEHIKSPETLVQAISIIRKEIPEAKALFRGSSKGERDGLPYQDWMRKTFPNMEGCEFIEVLPPEKLRLLFSRSRVLAMPSLYETFSMSMLEAMTAGRPVVVTATTGSAEFVRQNGGGQVIPSSNPRILAEALLPFLKDPSYAAQVGAVGRAAVRELLDPDNVAKQREIAYQKAIATFKRRRWCQRLSLSPRRYEPV